MPDSDLPPSSRFGNIPAPRKGRQQSSRKIPGSPTIPRASSKQSKPRQYSLPTPTNDARNPAPPNTGNSITFQLIPDQPQAENQPTPTLKSFDELNSNSDTNPDNPIKRRARGPLHPFPGYVRFASFLHLTSRLLFFAYLVSIPLVLHFNRPLEQALYLLPVLIACTLGWLHMASHARCRVCALPFLRSKRCIRSKKAPNFAKIGTHNSFAIVALSRPSVRCPYCGTINRFK